MHIHNVKMVISLWQTSLFAKHLFKYKFNVYTLWPQNIQMQYQLCWNISVSSAKWSYNVKCMLGHYWHGYGSEWFSLVIKHDKKINYRKRENSSQNLNQF